LQLNHLAIDKSEKFVIAHMRQMPGGWNIQKRGCESAHVIAHAADPVATFRRGTCHHDHVASFQIGHGLEQELQHGVVAEQ